jgi:hypothetical protein
MGAKKAYQDKMEAQLKEWRAKIDVLKAKADKAEADKQQTERCGRKAQGIAEGRRGGLDGCEDRHGKGVE